MRFLLPFLFLSIFIPSANAQFGISGTWNSVATPTENTWLGQIGTIGQGIELYSSGYGIAIDYWWRPEKFRLELMPELAFQQMTNDMFSTGRLQANMVGIRLNMNIYPFDFLSDCDCPTWSKQDPIFKKGFFIQLSPGYQMEFHQHVEPGSTGTNTIRTDSWRLAGGAGLDIGISDFITLTPLVRYAFFLGDREDVYETFPPFNENNGNPLVSPGPWSQWELGLRLGFRFDE